MPVNLDARPPPRDLTSLPDILAALSSLEDEESEVSSSLADLVATSEPIEAALANVKSLTPHAAELKCEVSILMKKVLSTANTANRVGGRVRSLDEQMRRVREASERVTQVMELKVRALFNYIDR